MRAGLRLESRIPISESRHVAIPKNRHDHVVAVREDVRGDVDALAGSPFDRESAAIDLGPDPFDDDAADERLVWLTGAQRRRGLGAYLDEVRRSRRQIRPPP